jgi:hypothetical protein
MGWETLARILHAEARLVGQAIALRGLSRFAVLRPADRRQKAIVCPTGHGAESTSCGWVSGEKTTNEFDGRGRFRPPWPRVESAEEEVGASFGWTKPEAYPTGTAADYWPSATVYESCRFVDNDSQA